MSDQSNICRVCNKPKIDELSYLMDERGRENSCRCVTAEPVEDDHKFTVLMCRTCQKRVQEGRQGSFTQWIFRHDLCSCENPQTIRVEAESLGPAYAEETRRRAAQERKDEPEIEIDIKGFPLDAYKPVEQLASGAVGHVYRCRSRLLGHVVAVKTLRSLTPDHLMQLQQEARSISRLNHENILKIYDFGLAQEQYPFMVIEYVKGTTLANTLKKEGTIDLRTAMPIFTQICDGLSHAHQRGIFHRDLSSGNVMIHWTDAGPVVKLIDFGLSLSAAMERQFVTAQGLTIVGTAAYMAPDQLAGKPYDASSEVYSLGCLMFETLTGSPPYTGETVVEVIAKHAEFETPRIDEAAPDRTFPPQLVEIVAKCLSKDKRDRYQSMDDLKVALLSLAHDLPERSSETIPKRNTGISAFAVATICSITLIAGLAGSYLWLLSKSAADAAKSNSHLDLLSSLGNTHATLELADRYLDGRGVGQSEVRAFELFQKAAASEEPQALYRLGLCYHYGEGVQKDVYRSRSILRQAAHMKHAPSEMQLAISYMTEVPSDPEGANSWLTSAANHGDPYAICIQGVRHAPELEEPLAHEIEAGDVSWSPDILSSNAAMQAVERFQKSAADRFAPALFNLGLCYERGMGVKSNREQAKKFYLLAAKQGEPDAQYRYAHILESEHDESHYGEMLRWYKKSARQNNWDANVALSRVFTQGLGTARDTSTAQEYLEKALTEANQAEHDLTNNAAATDRGYQDKLPPPSFLESLPLEIYDDTLSLPDKFSVTANGLVADDDLIQLAQVPVLAARFHYPILTGDGFAALENSSLIALVVPSKGLTKNGFKNIARMKNLQYLILNGKPREEGLAELKGAAIKSLTVGGTGLTPLGARRIGEIKSLEMLGFLETPHQIACMNELKALPKLRTLRIVTNKLSETIGACNQLELKSLRLYCMTAQFPNSQVDLIDRLACPKIDLTFATTHLNRTSVDKLLARPNIVALRLTTSDMSPQETFELQRKYPTKRLYIINAHRDNASQFSEMLSN